MEIKRIIVGELETNCYLLVDRGELVVIDPGGDPQDILHEVKRTKADPKFIINTHYHFDHTLANGDLKKKFGVPVLIHKNEKKFLNFCADRFLEDGEIIKIGSCKLKVVLTPGHSKGSICLFGPGFVFSGDTIFEMGIGRTDFQGGSDVDLKGSLDKLSNMIKPGTIIYPGHGEIFVFQNK